MKIDQHSLIKQLAKTVVHSSLDRYSLIEQSLCSEIL